MKQAAHYSPLAFLFSLALLGGTPAFGGAFEPSARWDQNEIRVCWLDSNEFKQNPDLLDETLYFDETHLTRIPEVTRAIEAIVTREFTPKTTGIRFSGFGPCRISAPGGRPESDAILAIEHVNSFDEIIEGGSSIGVSVVDWLEGAIVPRERNDPGMPSLVLQIPPEKIYSGAHLSYLEAIQLTALHEFGHLAGLHHEHSAYREEALRDPYCVNSPFGPDLTHKPDPALSLIPQKYFDTLFDLKGALRSGYDSTSIMSYCHTRQIVANGGRISLSAGDQALLKSVYSK